MDQTSGMIDFTDATTNNPTIWIWEFGDGSTSTDQHTQHSYASSGMYSVCLTVSNNAGSDTYCETINVVISSTIDPEKIVAVELFPNPVQNLLNIRLENDQPESLKFQLTDALGRMIKEVKVESNGSYQIDIKTLDSGIYYYIFVDQDGYIRNNGSLIKK